MKKNDFILQKCSIFEMKVYGYRVQTRLKFGIHTYTNTYYCLLIDELHWENRKIVKTLELGIYTNTHLSHIVF